MAYDAEIRVGTKVDTSQMQKLQIQINKSTDKVKQLTQKMREMKDTEIPTDEYKELQSELEKSEKYADSLYGKLRVMEKAGTVNTAPYKKLREQIRLIDAEIDNTRMSMQDLVDTGKAFTLGQDSDEYAKMAQQRSYEMANLQALYKKQDEAAVKQQNGGFKKLTSSAKKAFAALSSGAKGAFEKISSVAKKAFGSMNKDVKKTNGLLTTMRSRMQGLALSLLIFNQLTKAFNAMVSGAKEGISEFAKYSKDCNAVLSEFKSSLQTMKYNLGAAFSPIVQTIIPYLTTFINVLNSVISKISQFFAVLTGDSSYYRAIQQQVDFAGSLEDTANAAKEAAGALAGFDKLNVVKQQEDAGSSGSGSGAGSEFEEVPIDSNIKELAEKVKKILALLFSPLKEAWESEGQFVMESWRSALEEIGALVKDIGRDFLTVWTQEETVDIFEDILHILGDIGLVVANLARNFRLAWNENQNGLHILEGLRDLIGVIIKNIRNAADETVKWSEGLNFTPLMEKTSEWIQSLIPVVDSLSGILSDFYTQVLLPLAGWAVEEGLPHLLQVFIDFNNRVDWEGLRTRLAEFWKVLEPFAETIGEGLILFIGRLSEKIADFTNSETFKKILDWLEEKMSGTTPEDIADGIEKIAKAFIFFKGASLGLTALTTLAPAVTTIKSLVNVLTAKGAAAGAGELTTAMLGTADATGALTAGLELLVGLIGDVALAFTLFYVESEAVIWGAGKLGDALGKNKKQTQAVQDAYSGLSGKLNALKEPFAMVYRSMCGLPFTETVMSWDALDKAMEEIAKGSIYTDEQMKKMQETWQFTEEDMESLRQEMLDMNPELRAVADGFGLFDASAETLKDVAYGIQQISDGSISASAAFDEFSKPMWNMTEEAKAFFSELSNGNINLNEFQTSLLESAGYSNEFIASLNGAWSSADGFANGALMAGMSAGTALMEGLQNSTADMSSSVAALGIAMAAKAPEMSKQTNALGTAAVTGFNLGISQSEPKTDETVQTWMDGVEKSIHDSAMKFGSPSKTAKGFGSDTVTGYNDGIEKNVPKSVAVIKSYMQTIQSTFKELVTILFDIGQDSAGALLKGIVSRQGELKQAVKDMTELMGEAATASSGIKFSTGTSPVNNLKSSASQLVTSSIVNGGNPYGTTSFKQSAGQSGGGISATGIKQAMKEAMKESGGEYTFIAQINGKTIYNETVRQDQIVKNSTGKSRLGN